MVETPIAPDSSAERPPVKTAARIRRCFEAVVNSWRKRIGCSAAFGGREAQLSEKQPTSEEQKHFEELCKDIRKVSLVLLVYVFFCILVLLQPDENTLKAGGTFEMPVAGADVSFSGFLFIGPIVLCLILVYLHYLLQEWHKLTFNRYEYGKRFLFNAPDGARLWVSNFVFYGLGPFLLFFFTFKVRAWPYLWPIGFGLFAGIVTATLLLVYAWRPSEWKPPPGSKLPLCDLLLILAVLIVVLCPHNMASWSPLQLAHADLSEQDLKPYYLKNVFAYAANMKGADLAYSVLKRATFSFAKLEAADFTCSDLEGADFTHADLVGVDFVGANLKNAIFYRANLRGADLSRAHADSAEFGHATLDAVDVEETNFNGAKLQGATLEGLQNPAAHQFDNACRDKHTTPGFGRDCSKPNPTTPMPAVGWPPAYCRLPKDPVSRAQLLREIKQSP